MREKFEASPGWFASFKKQQGFHNKRIAGEVASADTKAARTYPTKLKKLLGNGEYSAKQVFFLDETGHNWKKMLSCMYIAKEENIALGFKSSKERE